MTLKRGNIGRSPFFKHAHIRGGLAETILFINSQAAQLVVAIQILSILMPDGTNFRRVRFQEVFLVRKQFWRSAAQKRNLICLEWPEKILIAARTRSIGTLADLLALRLH